MSDLPPDAESVSHDDEVAALVLRLHETQKRLQELTGNEVDAVVHPDGQSYLLYEAQKNLLWRENEHRIFALTQTSILNALPALVALIDHEGVITSVNEGWRTSALSDTLDSANLSLGQNFLDLFESAQGGLDAGGAVKAAAGIRAVLSGESAEFTLDYPLHSASGQHWYRLKVNARENDGSRGAVVMYVDITPGKLVEESLRKSEERFQSIFTSAAAGIAIATPEGRFIHANPAYCRMLGYTEDELLTRDFASLIHPGESSIHLNMQDELPAGQPEMYVIERRQVKKTGETVWARSSVSTVRQSDREIVMFILVSEDITERRQSEARFRRLVDSNAQCVIFWNTQGEISGGNESFLELSGYTREDLDAGRINWVAMTPPEYAHLDKQALAELASTGVCSLYEKEWIRSNGVRIPILLGSAMFEDNPNEGVSFVLDLTERKKLEQQFLQSQRLDSIGTLASGIAHDLNNALTPIILAIDILRTRITDPRHVELLDLMAHSTRRGADMVSQVLSFARGRESQTIDIQLTHLVAEIRKIASETFPKNIKIKTEIDRGLRAILGDPTQIHQVLLNLCVNARDAMPKGGLIVIRATNAHFDSHYAAMNIDASEGPYVCLEVVDSGLGIPKHIIDKIFDPFFTTKGIGEGTGLGLSTTNTIVKSHRGFVQVESEEGKGTSFRIYFPANLDATILPEDVEPASLIDACNGETILVVDDEESIREITRQTLEAFGYRVELAADGSEALALYATNASRIAAVITDMMMPVLDGPSTIRVLRRMNPAVKIIATSGISPVTSAEDTDSAIGRPNGFLLKPYNAQCLLKMLHQILNQVDQPELDFQPLDLN